MAREIERDDLEVTPDHILVLKTPAQGRPGMPNGHAADPEKLIKPACATWCVFPMHA